MRLTRRPNGTYMLITLRPLIRTRMGSNEMDAYERSEPGERIRVRHVCEQGSWPCSARPCSS